MYIFIINLIAFTISNLITTLDISLINSIVPRNCKLLEPMVQCNPFPF